MKKTLAKSETDSRETRQARVDWRVEVDSSCKSRTTKARCLGGPWGCVNFHRVRSWTRKVTRGWGLSEHTLEVGRERIDGVEARKKEAIEVANRVNPDACPGFCCKHWCLRTHKPSCLLISILTHLIHTTTDGTASRANNAGVRAPSVQSPLPSGEREIHHET